MAARLGRVLRILRTRGVRGLLATGLRRSLGWLERGEGAAQPPIQMLVRWEDAAAVDWTTTQRWQTEPRVSVSESIRAAWIMHPPGETSGGHQNIFRFISYLERAGHHSTVYLYDSFDRAVDPVRVRQMVAESSSYPDVASDFRLWEGAVAEGTDVILATGWETAYPAFLDPSNARRVYFVQDFEPAFYAVGSEHTLAENTYRFGFHGITAGGWLAERLRAEYGMRTSHFDFAADTSMYRAEPGASRDGVFFYARPVTARRGFELGAMALEEFARLRPEVPIHLAGWDVSGYRLGFPHEDHGAMAITDLNSLYNRCGAALVLSLTNLSLLPLELLAAGVIPVVNDGPNNRMVSSNPYIEYCDPSPGALAARLAQVLDREDLLQRSAAAAASVAATDWDVSGKQFVDALEGVVRG